MKTESELLALSELPEIRYKARYIAKMVIDEEKDAILKEGRQDGIEMIAEHTTRVSYRLAMIGLIATEECKDCQLEIAKLKQQIADMLAIPKGI